jgi:hypothetical protein
MSAGESEKKVDNTEINNDEDEAYLKVILLGDSMVGKSK